MKEYGGYLPLEIRPGSEYYCEKEGMKVRAMNSGKAALYYALKESGAERIYIPYYICQSVVEIARRAGTEVERYYIDQEFMPVDIRLKSENDMVLIVNYFGTVYDRVKEAACRYPQAVIDNTQAFFAKPVLRKGIYNIYSCKKFIGVPDGGYLIAENLNDILFERDFSSEYMDFCLQSIEYGTGYAYAEKKENDRRFLKEIREMSCITHRLLQGTDYEFIKRRRMENAKVLHEYLKKYNRLGFEELDFVPYYYPLYLEKGIQKELVEKRVYVPVLWRELLSSFFDGKIEKDFSANIVCLPVDQRYDRDDMIEIVRRVKSILGKV